MDIHDFENNLGELDDSFDKVEHNQNMPDEKKEEQCNSAVEKDGIHDNKPHENMVSSHRVNSSQQRLFNQKIKNNIIGSILSSKPSHPKAKSMIKAFSKKGKNVFNVKRCTTSKSVYNNNLYYDTIKHAYSNNMRETITPDYKEIPIPTKHNLSLEIRPVPGESNHTNFDYEFPYSGCEINNSRSFFFKEPEKPKEVNLAEVLTDILQEAVTGKLTNIDNAIGKLRTSYEEKNIFTNKKKRYISLINFEDDTLRPVFKIEDNYLDIIKKWYDDCDLLIDIEDTDTSIPENITIQDVSGVLFEDISNKNKDNYLKNYIPLVINNIISNRSIKCMEREFFEVPKPKVSQTIPVPEDKKIKELGIDIPSNINPNFGKSKNSNVDLKKNTQFWNNGYITAEIEDVISNDKYKPDKNAELLPFNSPTLPNNFDFFLPYNQDYNVLYPSFASTCESLTPDYSFLTKPSCNEIYVLINNKFLQTLVIKNPEKDCLHIIKNHPEFGFVKLFNFTTSNDNIINFIENEYNKVLFNNVDEINKKLLVTSQYIEFANKVNDSNILTSSEENVVKRYLTYKYSINNDINHKMKASTLHDIVINSSAVKIEPDKLAGFKTRLSKYLKDMGLQKKRYNDGFYYYGIVEKTIISSSSGKDASILNINLQEVKYKREEESKSYTFSNTVI